MFKMRYSVASMSNVAGALDENAVAVLTNSSNYHSLIVCNNIIMRINLEPLGMRITKWDTRSLPKCAGRLEKQFQAHKALNA